MIIDLHVHTQEVSGCSNVSVEDMIDKYHAKGYDAVVITNHFCRYTRDFGRFEKWDDFVDFFMIPINRGREYAKKYGMKIFWGIELRFNCDYANDFLVYGITEEFLKEHPNMLDMSIAEFSPIAREAGCLIYQAHPFRDWIQVIPPKFLDGVEVNNGHPYQNSRNDFARLWADANGLGMISGSDFHQDGYEAHGGIVTFKDIESNEQLCDILRSGEYNLICDKTGGLSR